MLPGFDLPSDWSVPRPWRVAYLTYDALGFNHAWGVKLENEETMQYTLGHYAPSAKEALDAATAEAAMIQPPNVARRGRSIPRVVAKSIHDLI